MLLASSVESIDQGAVGSRTRTIKSIDCRTRYCPPPQKSQLKLLTSAYSDRLQGVWYSCKAEGGKTYMNASGPELVKSFVDADALSTWLVCNCELA